MTTIVKTARTRQVELVKLLSLCCGSMLVAVDENRDADEASLVVGVGEQPGDFRKRQRAIPPCDLTLRWDRDAEKPIAFAVLPGTGAEEVLKECRLVGVTHVLQRCHNRGRGQRLGSMTSSRQPRARRYTHGQHIGPQQLRLTDAVGLVARMKALM